MTHKDILEKVWAIDEQIDVSHAHTAQLCKERSFLMQQWKAVFEEEERAA